MTDHDKDVGGVAAQDERAPYLPTYGEIPWDRLKAAVADAVGASREWNEDFYIGHQSAGINMNSLNRIVSGFVAEARAALAPQPPASVGEPLQVSKEPAAGLSRKPAKERPA